MAPGSEGDGGLALHVRLLRRDPNAPSELTETYLPPLVAWLRQTFNQEDTALLDTIAIDLILSLAEKPEQYKITVAQSDPRSIVTVQDPSGAPDKTATGEKILTLLKDQLK